MESDRPKVDAEIDVDKMERETHRQSSSLEEMTEYKRMGVNKEELEREIEIEIEIEITKPNIYRQRAEMECCIFKIPEELSKRNDKAYAPQAFSIGPFHYSNPRTKATQTIKLRYLADYLHRSSWTLGYLIDDVDNRLNRFRGFYDRPVDDLISPKEFIKLLVFDGCFVVELFFKNSDRDLRSEDDPIFSVPRMRQYLNHDLVLLENQIPWMVLESLFEFRADTPYPYKLLIKLALDFFHPIFSVTPNIMHKKFFEPGFISHILDLLRTLLLSTTPDIDWMPMDKTGNNGLEPVMLSATALEESGIKLQSFISGPKSILDVTFKDGVLEIPQLVVHDATDTLFRNLVALELCRPNYSGVITSYVKLLDDLVQTTADMKLLCDNKVVHNTLRLDKATRIFNQASEEYSGMRENHYSELIDAMDKYRRHRKGYYILRWRVYMRDLKLVYFSHPWTVISTIAASFILIFTFLQTLFTIMSYK